MFTGAEGVGAGDGVWGGGLAVGEARRIRPEVGPSVADVTVDPSGMTKLPPRLTVAVKLADGLTRTTPSE